MHLAVVLPMLEESIKVEKKLRKRLYQAWPPHLNQHELDYDFERGGVPSLISCYFSNAADGLLVLMFGPKTA